MSGNRAKWIRKLLATDDPVLLMAIRNKYGDRTNQMHKRKVYQVAKELWSRKELRHIKDWPKI